MPTRVFNTKILRSALQQPRKRRRPASTTRLIAPAPAPPVPGVGGEAQYPQVQ